MSDYSVHTELELKVLLVEGDKLAFREIYNRYWGILFVYARKLLDDGTGAEDVVQDVLTYIWEKRDVMDIKTSLVGYLYTAVRHRALTFIRREKSFQRYSDSLVDFMQSFDFSTENAIRDRELLEILNESVAALPPKMRRVFVMSKMEYLSKEEVASELGITPNTVRKQLDNAAKIIRRKINEINIF